MTESSLTRHSEIQPTQPALQDQDVQLRSAKIFAEQECSIYERTDRLFAGLLAVEWFSSIAVALVISPLTWSGLDSHLHPHVWMAVVIGAIIVSLPIYLGFYRPGRPSTRYSIAFAQIMMSVLLIHLTGGRIETHFHVFGSLAFLSFYRDPKVLLIATAVTAIDHFARGLVWPQSVYGTAAVEPWRWVEHAWWVVFEDFFLYWSIVQSRKEMWKLSERQAIVENANELIEKTVVIRTAELKMSEQRFKSLCSSSPAAIFQTDSSGNLLYVNNVWSSITGYSEGETLGRSWVQVVHPQESNIETQWKQALVEATSFDAECSFFNFHGEPRWVHIMASPQRNDDDEFQGFVATMNDITQRKEAEAQVSEFYSIVSHEMRSPLTSIRGSLRLIEGGMVGEVTQKCKNLVQIGRESCDRLIRLINDFLDMKKLEAGKVSLRPVVFTCEKAVTKALESVCGFADEQKLNLRSDIRSQGHITADFDRIQQVLINYLSNSIKFSPPSSEIIVRVTNNADNSMVRFEVIDQAGGIPAEKIQNLFKRFQQLYPAEVSEHAGTGLGLAVSKLIVEHHNGQVGVESTLGEGSTFWFELPLTHVEGADDKPQ